MARVLLLLLAVLSLRLAQTLTPQGRLQDMGYARDQEPVEGPMGLVRPGTAEDLFSGGSLVLLKLRALTQITSFQTPLRSAPA
ncbi:hypothetical protein TbrSNM41_25290 (plasmid) [Thermus brockianus]|uniref:Uncharacterized protein n=1 Tax=Thermus brockianus TaxID=56956 RepID=A0ABM7XN47_THEBO|nr:hypothetical protein TbrSNM41_25290 [Thermus brockianus]